MNIQPYQSERTLFLAYNNYFPYPGTSDDGVLSYSFLADIPNPYIKPEKILTQEYGAAVGLSEGPCNCRLHLLYATQQQGNS